MSFTMPENDLLKSALATSSAHGDADIVRWLKSHAAENSCSVQRIPLQSLTGWIIDPGLGNLVHTSGKFFKVEGIDIRMNYGSEKCWSQPIINQPEIGILGFLAGNIDGVLHLLAQAKMEPGNINLVQMSPTVQATRSNYTQVHGGRRPLFLDYFLDTSRSQVLVDQLQSEEGSRFFRKRNRNMIVLVEDAGAINHSEDFMWVTLGQIHRLAKETNLIHADSRSVIGSIPYLPGNDVGILPMSWSAAETSKASFAQRVFQSLAVPDACSERSLGSILGWLAGLKSSCELQTVLLPMNQVKDWILNDEVIRHESGKYFAVMGVAVEAGNREVARWSQPLIETADDAMIALVAQMRKGILHWLVQGCCEPGYLDLVELGATVQCSPSSYEGWPGRTLPPFVELVRQAKPEQIRFDSVLSQEGGRFYHSEQKHRVVELHPGIEVALPDHFQWMTLKQIQECARFEHKVNIELRSIISCLELESLPDISI